MANPEHLELLNQGVETWNQWRANPFVQKPDLRNANLSGFDLSGFDLSNLNLSEVDLSNANLSRTQALGTQFKQTILTGACLEDWNINSATQFEGVICAYVYLKANQQERRPHKRFFRPGEFSVLFQQAADTVDLIFKDGIDWLAFFQALQALRSQYADQAIFIQSIEKKQDDAFVVRLGVFETVDKPVIDNALEASKSIDKPVIDNALEASKSNDKPAIARDAQLLYEKRLKALEAQYEKQLRLQGEQHLEEIQHLIEAERQEKLALIGVLNMMTSNQGSKYDLRGAQFAGGFAESVQGNQLSGTINNTATTEPPSLTEAAADIQNLLKQLETSNPAATEADQTAYLNAIIPTTKRERLISALKSAGSAAIEEVPYGAVLKALVEGWQKPNG